MIEQVLNSFQAMSYWEYISVALGIAYIFLAMKQSLWCWPVAFVSTTIGTLLFWQGLLYMESLLNFYYLLMAIYGWWQWRGNKQNNELVSKVELVEKKIVSWSVPTHIKCITVCAIIAIGVGYMWDTNSDAKMPYLDSSTTIFAVFTTYLLTQKVLENWLYWVVIDFASIYLYWQNGYFPTAILFVIYTGLAWQGYRVWRLEHRQDSDSDTHKAVADLSSNSEHSVA